jgi:spermidine synthase
MAQTLKKAFSWVKPYMGVIPTYPTALWLFFHASKEMVDIHNIDTSRFPREQNTLRLNCSQPVIISPLC